MKRSSKPYDPRCYDCHEPIKPSSNHYRWDTQLQTLTRTCRKHQQGSREQLLDVINSIEIGDDE